MVLGKKVFLCFPFSHAVSTLYTGIKQDPSSRGLFGSGINPSNSLLLSLRVKFPKSIKELSDAEVRWLREVQVKEFGIKPDSADRVREFQPVLDQDGLLRVGGRLRRSTLPPESKHPIILPYNHPVTELLIKDHHVRQMHAGVNQTLVAIRTKLWIIRARNAVKKIIRSCPVCRRVDAQPYRLRMGDLPADRVTEIQPFIHTGVDFAGPLFIRPDVRGRDGRVNKACLHIKCIINPERYIKSSL
ncbi:hypothetical protein T03_9511 [Trichinella britovi]|uniref:Integrase zinc-binding domain-containing protein n=1 Tax=Trichinella britovi TaxID=45882 RepID=A0A0V1D5F5_TRIBR|nr:hypothetical protein T03_9511 [Trichinella britovi]